MSHTDHDKVLQVDRGAEAEVVQAAYRRLARKYHPDVAESPEAAARMAAINAAWAVLKDPASRAAYDTERAGAGHAGATRPHAAPPSMPPRHPAAPAPPPGDEPELDEWPLVGGKCLRPRVDGDARGPRRGRPAARQPVGERPELRSLRRLGAGGGRPPRPRGRGGGP